MQPYVSEQGNATAPGAISTCGTESYSHTEVPVYAERPNEWTTERGSNSEWSTGAGSMISKEEDERQAQGS